MKIDQAFPKLDDHISLHLMPHGGFLYADYPEGRRMHTLNRVGADILRLSNGEKSLMGIIDEVAKWYDTADPDPIQQQIHDFLSECKAQQLVDFLESPRGTPLQITGSMDFYLPIHFMVEITDFCNLRCRHCYRGSSPDCENFFPVESLKRVFQQMRENGVTSVEITGGEPLTHPEFLEIMADAADKFDQVAILSNGCLITPRVVEAIQQAACQTSIIIQIDLDGDNAQTHDNLRGVKGSFNRAKKALSLLSKTRAFIRVAMNVHDGNIHQIERVKDLAKSLGASMFSFSPILDIGRGEWMTPIAHEQFAELSNLAEKLSKEEPDFVFLGTEELQQLKMSNSNCGAGWRTLVLGPTGDLRPCIMQDAGSMVLGNLMTSEYVDVFKDLPLAYYYQLQPPSKEICGDCRFLPFCSGCFTRPMVVWERDKNIDCGWDKVYQLSSLLSKAAVNPGR